MEMIRDLFITHSLGFWVLLIGEVFKGNFQKFLSNATSICIKKFSENEWAKEYAEKECYERPFIFACGSRWNLKIRLLIQSLFFDTLDLYWNFLFVVVRF